jgi:nitronate monooxygenase
MTPIGMTDISGEAGHNPSCPLDSLRLPLFAAPMFLVSGVRLVQACCRQGIPGLFPALNGRTVDDFRQMLEDIAQDRHPGDAPFGVNLIVHPTNSRIRDELALCESHRVPLIVTGLGNPAAVVERVHAYGGLVFHEVATLAHAEKAARAGVDGLVLVCAGAGGHTGTLSPLAFVPAVRRFFAGQILVAGAITEGRGLLAVQAMGADFAYAGTLFLPCPEANTAPGYRKMVLDSRAADLMVSAVVSGAPASLLRPSFEAAGYSEQDAAKKDFTIRDKSKAWRDVWSAGQGLENLTRAETVPELVARLEREYRSATAELAAKLNVSVLPIARTQLEGQAIITCELF